MKKKKLSQKQEIMWNIINSLLAGAISFFSSMASLIAVEGYDSHEILTSAVIAFVVSGSVALIKFKDYWDGEKSEYQNHLFNLI